MPSKRSWFDPTLFRRDLTRFWPLWGGVTALGCLIPLSIALGLMQEPGASLRACDVAEALYSVLMAAVPALTMGYAAVVAMAVWSYLFSARAVGMMHALPVTRTALFVTHALSGLAMLLIPYAAVGTLTGAIALCHGAFDGAAFLTAAGGVFFETLLFFGMATFCAMVTGRLAALPVFYLIANYLAVILEWLYGLLQTAFCFGVSFSYADMPKVFSPVMELYADFTCSVTRSGDGSVYTADVQGFWIVAMYGAAGAVLLVLSCLLYRRRDSERAGDVVAFPWLRPVFRYGVALCSALSFGHLLYELIWGSFQAGPCADTLPMALCMVLGGLTGYYIASMLVEKTVRVFRGSWKGALAAALGSAIVCLAVGTDVFGVESYVPKQEDVASVSISCSAAYSSLGPLTAGEDDELIARVLEVHRAVADDAEHFKHDETDGSGETAYTYLGIRYTLKDGRTVSRNYYMYLTRERYEQGGTADRAVADFEGSSELQVWRVSAPAGYALSRALAEVPDDEGTYVQYELSGEEAQAVYEALLSDAQSGNMSWIWPFAVGGAADGTDETAVETVSGKAFAQLTLTFIGPAAGEDDPPAVGSKWFDVTGRMENILRLLTAMGYMDPAPAET